MKFIILVALALVAVAVAAPAEVEPVKILRSEYDQTPEGGYQYSFESEDGTKRQESGQVKEVFDEEKKSHQVVVVRGSYTYTNAEGKPETVSYSADENGFRAEGDSIPKPTRR